MRPLHIILEGISGSGKDTQIGFAAEFLGSEGYTVKVFSEPSEKVKQRISEYKRKTPEERRDARWELETFVEDRKAHVKSELKPLLQTENVAVIKNRSFLSTVASQSRDGLSMEEIISMHFFYPSYDLALILLCDPKVAMERTVEREKNGGIVRSPDEVVEKIARNKVKYEEVQRLVPRAHIINTNGSRDAVRYHVECFLAELIGKDMGKAVFLDKDGTLVANKGYPSVIPSDEVYFEHTVVGLRRLQEAGYRLFIHSSQPWVARGRMSEEEVVSVFESVKRKFAGEGVYIDHYGFCPHGRLNEEVRPGVVSSIDCVDKKPNTGLLEKAARLFNIDVRQSYMIGDSDDDILAGKNFGLKSILVKTGSGTNYVGNVSPHYICKDVNEAANKILTS